MGCERHRAPGLVSSAFVLCCTLVSTSVYSETLTGRVVYVADGDSISVEDNGVRHRVRLSGIDAPELGQAYGRRAKQRLFSLLYDKTVSIAVFKYDEHGRIVGKVMVASPDACPDDSEACPKTLDAGLSQITVGLAWWYRYYAAEQDVQDRHRYEFAEFEARSRKQTKRQASGTLVLPDVSQSEIFGGGETA